MRNLLLSLLAATCSAGAGEPSKPCYELRVYYAAPGKLDALNARFREHTVKLFEKHGMTNVGYWMPIDNPDRQLIYLLAFPDRAAAKKSWQSFGTDPAWREVVKKTEANGRLVSKVDSLYLQPTDYSPPVTIAAGSAPQVFEMRTYQTPPGKLDALNARFRDHTLALFTKHGIKHFGYWTPTDAQAGADNTLIYLLRHPSKEAADAAFKNFRADPAWIAAKAASEKDGPLTLPAPAGVKSVFMTATDYSASR